MILFVPKIQLHSKSINTARDCCMHLLYFQYTFVLHSYKYSSLHGYICCNLQHFEAKLCNLLTSACFDINCTISNFNAVEMNRTISIFCKFGLLCNRSIRHHARNINSLSAIDLPEGVELLRVTGNFPKFCALVSSANVLQV